MKVTVPSKASVDTFMYEYTQTPTLSPLERSTVMEDVCGRNNIGKTLDIRPDLKTYCSGFSHVKLGKTAYLQVLKLLLLNIRIHTRLTKQEADE